MKTQTLHIIRGAPGAGKSTFATKLMKDMEGEVAHFEADMYHIDKDGNYNWQAANIKKAHNWCYASVVNAIEHNTLNVIVSNTFIKLWELEKYLQIIGTYNLEFKIYHLTTQYENIHNVPPETIQRMLNDYEPHENDIEIKD